MPRFMPDTNSIVALLSSWHEHHERVTREFERRMDAGETLTLAALRRMPS
jgi:predicted nucleic acid-binding protein